MWTLKKSSLFIKQVDIFSHEYKSSSGVDVATRFVDAVEEAIEFVQNRPLACRVYQESKQHSKLQQYEFRKWWVKGFPYSIFFRVSDDKEILLEAIYAHKMDIAKRFSHDLKN